MISWLTWCVVVVVSTQRRPPGTSTDHLVVKNPQRARAVASMFFVRTPDCSKPSTVDDMPDSAWTRDFFVVLPARLAIFVSSLLRRCSGGRQGSSFGHGLGHNLKDQRYRDGELQVIVLNTTTYLACERSVLIKSQYLVHQQEPLNTAKCGGSTISS
jgi:hypothetical protein